MGPEYRPGRTDAPCRGAVIVSWMRVVRVRLRAGATETENHPYGGGEPPIRRSHDQGPADRLERVDLPEPCPAACQSSGLDRSGRSTARVARPPGSLTARLGHFRVLPGPPPPIYRPTWALSGPARPPTADLSPDSGTYGSGPTPHRRPIARLGHLRVRPDPPPPTYRPTRALTGGCPPPTADLPPNSGTLWAAAAPTADLPPDSGTYGSCPAPNGRLTARLGHLRVLPDPPTADLPPDSGTCVRGIGRRAGPHRGTSAQARGWACR